MKVQNLMFYLNFVYFTTKKVKKWQKKYVDGFSDILNFFKIYKTFENVLLSESLIYVRPCLW